MLIENQQIQMNDVVCLKMANGDELIAKFISKESGKITVMKPLMMVVAAGPGGQPGIQLVPFWMVGGDADTKYPVSEAHVICMIKANEDARKGYQNQTSSILQPGGSSLIR